ncbi:methyltransferase domain-containing protein [Brevibacillus ruminantium]|uniref:Methyltransferase domain-containing protein n=1 Tax=Brevibacillus ruminantium TaxID=2950604 RepID=A0ABY4W9M5_9BACL|nr:methyltransferase domain-containing protein [Brevibacillus ruminantium]USG63624.1 methyltransferase domain-containing protein [Brevibacillus ruminantium]
MSIDFHAPKNRDTYSSRRADSGWREAMGRWVDPAGLRVIDLGCGGGIYTEGWAELGAGHVVGVDFSETILEAAREKTKEFPEISYHCSDACQTALPDESADIVFSRALLHHVKNSQDFFHEAYRLLAPGGVCIIQNRTLADVTVPGSADHLRGFFFEAFPKLLAFEQNRRPADEQVRKEMRQSGFTQVTSHQLWEVRRTYQRWVELERDLGNRTGRSLLHELTDQELRQLINYIHQKIEGREPIHEQDRWTVWVGVKG